MNEEKEVPETPVDTTVPEEAPEAKEAPEVREDTTIPVGALQEERRKRQALEQKWSRAEQRLNDLTSKFSAKEKEEEQWANWEPEWDDNDPDSQWSYMKSKIDGLEKNATAFFEEQQNEKAQQQFIQSYNRAAEEFSKSTPDFEQAAGHYWTKRREELEILGLDPVNIDQVLQNDFLGVAYQGIQTGQNPAEKIYELAKLRGYQTQDDTKIERLQKGANAAKSLSSAGGKPESSLTLEVLEEMSDEEFAELMEKEPDAFRKVMGG